MTASQLAERASRALADTTRAWTADEFADLLAAQTTVLMDRPNAFAIGRVVADEAELFLLATDPDCRRLGHGRSCLAAFEAACAARGATEVFLEVSATNTAALTLYRTQGYDTVGERPGYYPSRDSHRETALTLRKTLQRAGPA